MTVAVARADNALKLLHGQRLDWATSGCGRLVTDGTSDWRD
jgi:hypothetical protein